MHCATDPRGHVLWTSSDAAAGACNAGVEGYAEFRADAMDRLDAAIAADVEFALPKLVKAWVLHGARDANYASAIERLAGDAQRCVDSGDDRAVDYLEALRLAREGRGVESATVLEGLLDRHPTDLLAHRVLQFELFWNGRADWMCDVVERAAPRWDEHVDGYATYLSCRAFSNEEAGRYEAAERYARAAVELDPAEVWGAHAFAHVALMQGRHDEGRAWLESLCGNWGAANQLKHHLWWHLCLFLLESGDHARILELLRTEIRNPDSPLVRAVPDATIDIQNVASLLLRLELRGIDVGDRWTDLAEVCAGRVHDHANAFSNIHDVMVLAATGQFAQADELVESAERFGTSGDGSLHMSYRAAGVAACRAMLAHRRGDYESVVALLAPVRHDLALFGGSHAQRDIFYQVLVDACRRLGRSDLVAIFVRDTYRIGFDRVESRSLYCDATGPTQSARGLPA